jgi:hypothetical protein
MNKPFPNNYFVLLFILCSPLLGMSQPVLKASVDKNRVVLGEPFHLRIQANFPRGQSSSLPHIDSIPHFELRGHTGPVDTNINGQKSLVQEYLLASFDSGHWVIPRFKMAKYFTDSIAIDVVFSDFDPSKDYHDIKDIIEVEPASKKTTPWWLFAAGILFLGIFLWQILKSKKKQPIVKAAPPVNAYKEAMEGLEKIRNSSLPAVEYYSALIQVFRLYIFRKKGLLSLQETTDELIIQLRSLLKDEEGYDILSQSLRLSDFVKFAKYHPTSEEDRNVFETIKKAITTIENKSQPVLSQAQAKKL